MLIILSIATIAAAWTLLILQVDPVPTWFYVFVWYPTLVLLDELGTRLDGRPSMLWRGPMLFVFLWSPVVWFVFEVANFRLENWYYIFLPHAAWERWCGIVLSFATVVPAVLLAERLLDAAGLFRKGRGPALVVRQRNIIWAIVAGLGMGVLALAYPRTFFPLIWGAAFLIVDPIVYLRQRSLSLIGDVARGSWGRIGRLMVGGLGIGLLWESYNFWARGKWVYTVPWLEELKLFEMPPLGFAGFPVFTLEAWSMYAALCLMGVAAPTIGKTNIRIGRLVVGLSLGLAFSAATIAGMHRYTISSTAPVLTELPGATSEEVEALNAAGVATVFDLAGTEPATLAANSSISRGDAAVVVETARLATLRGIGNTYAKTLIDLGIASVCELSEQHPATLLAAVKRVHPGPRPNGAEVRVWIRAAARECPNRLDLSTK